MKLHQHYLLSSIYLSVLIVSMFLFSCKKETIEPEVIVPTPPTAPFTWQENGGAAISADSAYWTTGTWGTGIRAFKGAEFFEINWNTPSDISIGTKVLAIPYGFTFLKSSATYTCSTNQNLAITASASNAISGNSTVQVSGGTITSIAITFTSLPFKP